MTVVRWRWLVALVGVLLVAGCLPERPEPPAPTSSAVTDLTRTMEVARITAHLEELQRIADEHGGHRSVGSPGYDASVDHVSTVLRELGFTVRLEPFDYEFPRIVAERAEVVSGADVALDAQVMVGSIGTPGAITASVATTATAQGCSAVDYDAVAGAIVLVARGGCEFEVKARLAAEADAVALLVHEVEAGAPSFRGAIADAEGTVASAAISADQGSALREALAQRAVEIELDLRVELESGTTVNVIADWPERAAADEVVMIGAHLDSVPDGPGINDNASGVALVLAIAETLVEQGDPTGLRIGLWGAEELGLLGSLHHVQQLSDTERSRVSSYLNFDMVASPNGVFGVYGSRAVTRRLAATFEAAGHDVVDARIGNASDHAPFDAAGIPVGGIFTGADDRMSDDQAETTGGVAGEPYDSCYHRDCDTLDQVVTPYVTERLETIGDVAVVVVADLLEALR